MSKTEKDNLGPCRMACGREATSPKHGVCATCYPSLRIWSNVKTPAERKTYLEQLMLRQRRVNAIDQKLVVIGTSPYNWKARKAKTNVVQFRRQRGGVR